MPSQQTRKNEIAYQRHEHQHCIDHALDTAEALCAERGVRLTATRKLVLRLIWQSHKPLGAYALMDMLADATGKRIAPPTIYRALDFLQQQQLVHKVLSLNAYIGCCSPRDKHGAASLFICQHCSTIIERNSPQLYDAMASAVAAVDFYIDQDLLEVSGLCPNCRQQSTT